MGDMDKIILSEKLALITEHWRPKVVGSLNGQEVKLVKFRGEFPWHYHEAEDELFLGVEGRFRIRQCGRPEVYGAQGSANLTGRS
jgi:hypothetical protein